MYRQKEQEKRQADNIYAAVEGALQKYQEQQQAPLIPAPMNDYPSSLRFDQDQLVREIDNVLGIPANKVSDVPYEELRNESKQSTMNAIQDEAFLEAEISGDLSEANINSILTRKLNKAGL